MELPARSNEIALEYFQFHDEIRRLMAPPTENASSFTALLELPHSSAVELLHLPEPSKYSAVASSGSLKPYFQHLGAGGMCFPANSAPVERASTFAVETDASSHKVKDEPQAETTESDSNPIISLSQPLLSDFDTEDKGQMPGKRKDREKKAKGSAKKSKNQSSGDAEELPYVHVRARRGEATDRHSLAERARREKINARMKLLRELVPGCNKISGTALVLDEIINHVQTLQRQVELLSMRLAAETPRMDVNLDSIFTTESASLVDQSFSNMVYPLPCSDPQPNILRQYQQYPWHLNPLQHPMWVREELKNNPITSKNSHMSDDSPANPAAMHSRAMEKDRAMKIE
ncbi:hypothetical protein SAY87_026939 [Trapa incisa]|uniref:BHLH domain-containing protein n=1 Tax=Trapa incisa TaxID=236973 RepID=A0AAN7H0A0_9MYRT|nr:hypothetical protein SAY87_026939 [Trapa incisa]